MRSLGSALSEAGADEGLPRLSRAAAGCPTVPEGGGDGGQAVPPLPRDTCQGPDPDRALEREGYLDSVCGDGSAGTCVTEGCICTAVPLCALVGPDTLWYSRPVVGCLNEDSLDPRSQK